MITIQDNLFDLAVLDECNKVLNNVATWSYGWHSNVQIPYGHWNFDITKTDRNNPTDVSDRLPDPFNKVWEELDDKIFKGKAAMVRCYANRHTFGTEAIYTRILNVMRTFHALYTWIVPGPRIGEERRYFTTRRRPLLLTLFFHLMEGLLFSW